MSSQHFTVKFDNRMAEITPPRADLIGPLLEVTEQIPTNARNGEIAWTAPQQRLWDRLANGTICFPAGSVSRVASELRRLGHDVTLNDVRRRSGAGFAVDGDYHQSLHGYCRGVADAVVREHSGLVRLPGVSQAVEATGTLLRLLPKARAVIAVATKQERRLWYEGLLQYVPGNIEILGHGTWDSSLRVVVGTYGSLEAPDPQGRDVLIFANAISAIASLPARARNPYQAHRVFGFLPQHHEHDDRTRLRLEALCGTVIFDAGAAQQHHAATQVFFVEWPNTPIRLPKDALAAKRTGIWHNKPRNQAIACLATKLAAGDSSVLMQNQGSAGIEAMVDVANGIGRTVVIVAESSEHGRELQRLLPGWPLYTANAANPASAASRASSDSGGNRNQIGSIVTQLYAAKNTIMAEIVLWAAGGGKVLPVRLTEPRQRGDGRGHGQRGHHGDDQHGYGNIAWVDLADENDSESLAATIARAAEYRRLGWEVSLPAWVERTGAEAVAGP